MAGLEITLIPCLRDNYAYLLSDPAAGIAAVVDPSEAAPVIAALDARGLALTHILNTHHHFDHTGGNQDLKDRYGARVLGPAADRDRIPGLDDAYADGDVVQLGPHRARVFDIPGHTRGHIAFWFEEAGALFTGDTLFAMGCGRLFEGTPAQMWASLRKLRALPAHTRVYCGHEYTHANARFALTIEPDNTALTARAAEVRRLRAEGQPTIPTTLADERATNPFLRADIARVQQAVGLAGADPVAVFAEIRSRKDGFAG